MVLDCTIPDLCNISSEKYFNQICHILAAVVSERHLFNNA